LGLVLCLLFVGRGVFRAQTTGDIEGTVTDPSGAPIFGATVEARSASMQGIRTASSGTAGSFRIPAVPPGTYGLKASRPGFTIVEKTAVVTLDATAVASFTLQIAALEEVVVSGEAPVVDTSSTTTGTSYTAKVIERLPLGRNYASIVALQPGVQEDTGDRQGRGLALAIYGSTSAENVFLIDGINTNNVNRGVQGKIINNEFIQEVEVKTGGYQAEYGRATGGIINVITKSGGNQFHADVFVNYSPPGFRSTQAHEDDDLINLTFDEVDELDYGAGLGGFLLRDRLWFFTAYNRSEASRDRVPRAARLVSGQHFGENLTYDLFSGKLTWNVSSGSTLVATYFRDPEHRDGAVFTPTAPDPVTFAGRIDLGAEDYAGRFNRLFGSFGVLTLQYSKHQDRFVFKPLDRTRIGIVDRTNPADAPFFPLLNGFGVIRGYRDHHTGDRDEAIASVTAYFGNHELKVGGDYLENVTRAVNSFTGGERIHVRTCSANERSLNYCPPGEGASYVNYLGVTTRAYFQHDFYSPAPGSLETIPYFVSAPPSKLWSGFLQDSWKVTNGLTVNAGLREIAFNGRVQPRLGIVFDWKGDGSSKLFASYGRFSYVFPNDLNVRVYGEQFNNATFNYSLTSRQPGGPPNRNLPAHGGILVQGGIHATPVDRGLEGTYHDEYALGVEMALTPTFAVGLKGMYRRLGSALEDRCDLDYNDVETNLGSTCAFVNPGSGERWAGGGSDDFAWCDTAGSEFVSATAGQCFPDGAPALPGAARRFKGVELMARKTLSSGLWAQFSYLYSELTGNYDGAVRFVSGQTDPGINADFDYPLFTVNADGRLSLDRPHQTRVDAVYNSPFGFSVGFGAFWRSGLPVSRYGWYNVFYPDGLHLVPRGRDSAVSGGRLPAEYEANLAVAYTFALGALSITPSLSIFNLMDRQGVLRAEERFNPDGTFCEDATGCTPENTPEYTERNFERLGPLPYGAPVPQSAWARPTARQEPRYLRASLKISF
jgi:hypothetical protein